MQAKLGDLNVSKIVKKGLSYTQTGTPYYASPEVWKDTPHDNKSDIWSLGCVLYEMCNLRHAFDAQSIYGLAVKILRGSFPPINQMYSKQLRDLISKML